MLFKKRWTKLFALMLCVIVFILSVPVFADENVDGEDGAAYDNILEAQPVFSGDKLETTLYDELSYADTEAFTDVTEEQDRYVVGVLQGLGFMQGLEDNTFGAEQTITRSEFLEIVLYLLNVKPREGNVPAYFTDVDPASEATAVVAAAAELGLVRGNGDSLFYPDRAITCDEARMMLARALGYGVFESMPEEMETMLRRLAVQDGLYEGVENTGNIEITRLDAAYLVYNCLNVPVLQFVGYGDAVEFVKKEDDTILSLYHKIERDVDRINANFVSALPNHTTCSQNEIVIGDTLYKTNDKDYYELFAYEVEFWYRTENGVKTIVYLTQYQETDSLIIKAENIEGFQDLTYTYTVGDRTRTARIAPNHKFIVNGIYQETYAEEDFVPPNGEVVLISDSTGVYDVVVVNTFHAFLMSKMESDKSGKITFQTMYDLPVYQVDLSENDTVFAFYVNGRKINFSSTAIRTFDADGVEQMQYRIPDLPENVVANFFADKYEMVLGQYLPANDAKLVKVYITDTFVNGQWEAEYEDAISVSANKLELAKENLFDAAELDWNIGDSGKILLDYDQKAFAVIPDGTDTEAYQYAYLIDAALDEGGFSSALDLKLLHTTGDIKVYSFKDALIVNDEKYKDMEKIYNMLLESAQLVDSSNRISQVVKIKKNADGSITHLQILRATDDHEDALTKDWGRGTMWSRYENEDMLFPKEGEGANMGLYNGGWKYMFVVPDKETGDDKDYTVVAEWLPSNTGKTIEVYDVNDHLIPGVLVSYYQPEVTALNDPYAMVDYVSYEMNENGDWVSVLHCANLINGYEGALATVYSEDLNLFDGLQQGDLIKLYGLGTRVDDWTMVISIEDVKNFDISTLPERATSSQKYDLYEVYATRIRGLGNDLILQRGPIVQGVKRAYQQVNRAGYGFVYDETNGDPVVDMFYTNAESLLSAKNHGNEAASYVYVWESSTVTKLMVAYKLK